MLKYKIIFVYRVSTGTTLSLEYIFSSPGIDEKFTLGYSIRHPGL
jgi:hypothetical protein